MTAKIINRKPAKDIFIERLVAAGIIFSGITGIGLSIHANYMSPYIVSPNRSVIENWGIVFLVMMVVLAYFLKRLQGGLYLLPWLQIKQPTLNDKQTNVRLKFYEQSYGLSLIILIWAIWYVGYHPVQYALSVPGNYNLVIRIVWGVGTLIVALPSVLASLRNNS